MTLRNVARFSLAACCALSVAGCIGTQSIRAKAYDLSSGEILQATFVWKGTGQGPVKFERATETCEGEYQTTISGKDSVGVGVGGWGSIFTSMYSMSTVDKAQKGAAVVVCPSHLTFDCEYVTNLVGLTKMAGHGVCKDNKGGDYRVMF